MDFQILHFYPDLMNLYGSYANVSVLARLLERLGHTVTVTAVNPAIRPGKTKEAAETTVNPGEMAETDGTVENDSPALLSHADFVYMGAGTERRQRFAMEDFTRYAEAIKAAGDSENAGGGENKNTGDGVPMLFAGTAMELLGESVTTADGEMFAGIGLSGFTTVQGRRRIVGDVYGHTDLFPESIVGFMNKSAVIAGIDTPLINSLKLGFGNEAEGGPEGFRRGNIFGSELTGPILVKNPRLLETIAAAMLKRRGIDPPPAFPLDEWALKGYAVTERELQLRCQ